MDTAPRMNQGINAYRLLKKDIISGNLAPDSKLLMSALRERYSIGTGPLREALSQLVAEHLVVAISQRGYRVASMSIAELNDIYDARAHLEGLIVGMAIDRGDDAWEAEVIAQAHTLSKVLAVSGPDDMLDIWDYRHKKFHAAIAVGCGSHHLIQVRAQLLDQAERYRHLWLRETVFSQEALEQKRDEHAQLLQLILERKADEASQYVREHLLTPVAVISSVMRDRHLA